MYFKLLSSSSIFLILLILINYLIFVIIILNTLIFLFLSALCVRDSLIFAHFKALKAISIFVFLRAIVRTYCAIVVIRAWSEIPSQASFLLRPSDRVIIGAWHNISLHAPGPVTGHPRAESTWHCSYYFEVKSLILYLRGALVRAQLRIWCKPMHLMSPQAMLQQSVDPCAPRECRLEGGIVVRTYCAIVVFRAWSEIPPQASFLLRPSGRVIVGAWQQWP